MIYGYLRKSSEEGKTSSFDTQKFKINSYCNIHNLRVNEWFEDVCSGGLLLYQREQGSLLTTKLKKGDTIMIVEAMKTMNHVPSPYDGVVKEICVSDGQPVEFDQVIVILN